MVPCKRGRGARLTRKKEQAPPLGGVYAARKSHNVGPYIRVFMIRVIRVGEGLKVQGEALNEGRKKRYRTTTKSFVFQEIFQQVSCGKNTEKFLLHIVSATGY